MHASLIHATLSSLCLAAMLSVAGGCRTTDTAPSAGHGDPYPAPMNDPQITLLSPELRPWIVFQPAVIVKDDDGDKQGGGRPMHIEVPVRNTTYNEYLLEYRFLFFDENGRRVKPEMGWTFLHLDPKQLGRAVGDAMDTSAEDYRLEVRWSR